MIDPWFLPDVIDREPDVMGDAMRFDNGLADSIIAVALVEHVGHRQNGFECIALSAASRTNIGFTRRYADAVVEDSFNRLRRNAGTVVLDDDGLAVDHNRYDWRDLRFFGGVERVVE